MLSALPYLDLVSCAFGTIFIGFGILPFFNGSAALGFFELPYPDVSKSRAKGAADWEKAMKVMLVVYGIRDIFVGVAIYAAAFAGSRQALGWITLAAGVVAVADGVACKVIVGKGQMNHWGYAPAVIGTGCALLGVFDRVL